MDQTALEGTPETQDSAKDERRRAARVWVAGVAVMRGGAAQPPTVWRVTNLSLGGAGLMGDGSMGPGRHALSLHVAGFQPLELEARVQRQQVLTRGGRCAVTFVDVTEPQMQMLRTMTAADHTPAMGTRRALVVTPDEVRARALAGELGRLGFSVRREPSAGQAVAWLQREETAVLLVDERVVDADRWNVLQFVHDTSPETRRLVIANDVRGFRLYYAMKAGLVEGLIEPGAAGEALARHLIGPPAAGAAPLRSPRGRAAR